MQHLSIKKIERNDFNDFRDGKLSLPPALPPPAQKKQCFPIIHAAVT